MPEVRTRDVTLHYQLLGLPLPGGPQSGSTGMGVQTVAFLHGLVMDNLSSWYFSAANAVAAQGHRVLLHDLRGHGRSERPASGYTLAAMTDDCVQLLDALGLAAPVYLVGNSFGGLMALALARSRPERVAGLVLVDGHVGGTSFGEQMARTLSLRGETRDTMIAHSFQNWLGRNSERKRNRLAASALSLVEQTSLVEDVRSTPAFGEEELRGVRCPVLALYGENSDLRPCGEWLARTVPTCELRILPGCSHSVLWEATDTVRDAIIGFVARRSAP